MERKNSIIEQLQDYAKLQDVLILIEHALDGGSMDFPLPTFNDEWTANQVEKILDMIKADKK